MNTKNLFLTGILTIALSCPAMADIAVNANSAKCDNGTLDTYQGESTLQAQWDANTINLKWYTDSSDNNGQEITPANNAAISCEYDSSITLPTNPISKPGYKFAGWRVRVAAAPSQPQQTTFDLSTLSEYIEDGGIRYYARGLDGEEDYCFALGEDTADDAGAQICEYESAALSDVSMHQWKTTFEYGTVRGEARCSTQHPETFWYDNYDTFTSDHFATTLTEDQEEEAQYCWCKPTGFDAEGDGTYLNVSSSSWGFTFAHGNSADCAFYCAYDCGNVVRDYADFRGALYGVTQ